MRCISPKNFIFLTFNSLQCVQHLLQVQTIIEQKKYFKFFGEMKAIYTGLLIYSTLPICIHLIKFPFDHFFLLIQCSFWNSSMLSCIFSNYQICDMSVKFRAICLNTCLYFLIIFCPSLFQIFFVFSSTISFSFFRPFTFWSPITYCRFWHWFAIIVDTPTVSCTQ